ncbi:MAG: hypothetical protein JWR27_2936 [Aeromicrobium sp.]|nr:hypothetical protein [Aeromicrobium sp.]
MQLNPAPGAHRVALRAGLSVAVPLLTVVLIDRTPWAVYAAFGAFAALYGRNHVHLPRAVMQATAGLALVAAVVLGSAFAAAHASPWALVVGGAVVAAIGSLLSTALDWHPPGPLFLVIAFGTVASSPGGWSDVPTALLVSTASAAFALAVGSIGSLARHQTAGRPHLRSPWNREPLRFLIAVGLAGAIATAAGIGHPYWAMVAAAAPLTVRGRDHQAVRAAHRIAGTVLGLMTTAPLLLLGLDPVPLVLTIVALQIVAELLVGRNYGLALLFITPMALLTGQLGSSRPAGELLFDRAVETAIGALVAVAFLLAEHWHARARPARSKVPSTGDRRT